MTEGRHRREAGFTLLEVLIATTLLGLLAGLIFSGMRLGARAWSTVNSRVAATTDTQAVADVLRGTIGQAYPAFLSDDLADRRVSFAGEPGALAFIAPLPAAIEPGVMARQRYFLASENGRTALYWTWRLDLPAADDGSALREANPIKLVDNIGSMRFSYFGTISAPDPPQWLEQWSDRTSIPKLVRIAIRLADPAAPAWPDVIVALRRTTTTDCLYDPADLVCRRSR